MSSRDKQAQAIFERDSDRCEKACGFVEVIIVSGKKKKNKISMLLEKKEKKREKREKRE